MFRFFLTLALFAAASAFLSSKLAVRTQVANSRLFSECADKMRDAKGKCPGDTGYIPLLKEAPTDFAAYAAAQKAKKEAAAKGGDGRCADKLRDAKGKCPGDTGYIPLMKEAPVDFAAYAAAQKAKKEAAAKGK